MPEQFNVYEALEYDLQRRTRGRMGVGACEARLARFVQQETPGGRPAMELTLQLLKAKGFEDGK